MSKEYLLLCLENPLLDIQANCDPSFLIKYNLKKNDAILVDENRLPIFEDITTSYPTKFLAGGAAQNTARGAQYMLPPKSVVYIGCVGKDAHAEQLAMACAREGLRTEYRVDEDHSTGRCAVIITGHDRSMVTDLGASNCYKIDHLKSPKIWELVENAKFLFVGGYHLTVCVPAILALAEHAADADKVFIMSLSAPFICQFFKNQMDSVLPYCDYVIGNETEALSYAECHDIKTEDIFEIAKAIANIPKKNTNRSRVVIITQGSQPTIVARSTGQPETMKFEIRKVEDSDIVDTNGAGDAFLGGFLAGLLQEKSLDTCVDMGHWLASWVIRETGPAYPAEKKIFTDL